MFGLFSFRAAEAMSNFSVMIGDLQFDFFANRDGVNVLIQPTLTLAILLTIDKYTYFLKKCKHPSKICVKIIIRNFKKVNVFLFLLIMMTVEKLVLTVFWLKKLST